MRVVRVGCTPVKGLRHASLASIELDEHGPVGDRDWCLVGLDGGAVLRSVDHPALVSVRAEWDGSDLRLALPGGEVVTGPPEPTRRRTPVDYWGRPVTAHLHEGAHAALLSNFLGKPVRLGRVDRGDVVYGASVSLVTTASVAEAAARLGRPDLADQPERFRPTFVVEADEPYVEDAWVGRDVAIGDAVIRVHGPMGRCGVVNLDPETGRADAALLRSLIRHRPRTGRGEPLLAVDATVVSPGSVRRGDTLQVDNDPQRTRRWCWTAQRVGGTIQGSSR